MATTAAGPPPRHRHQPDESTCNAALAALSFASPTTTGDEHGDNNSYEEYADAHAEAHRSTPTHDFGFVFCPPPPPSPHVEGDGGGGQHRASSFVEEDGHTAADGSTDDEQWLDCFAPSFFPAGNELGFVSPGGVSSSERRRSGVGLPQAAAPASEVSASASLRQQRPLEPLSLARRDTERRSNVGLNKKWDAQDQGAAKERKERPPLRGVHVDCPLLLDLFGVSFLPYRDKDDDSQNEMEKHKAAATVPAIEPTMTTPPTTTDTTTTTRGRLDTADDVLHVDSGVTWDTCNDADEEGRGDTREEKYDERRRESKTRNVDEEEGEADDDHASFVSASATWTPIATAAAATPLGRQRTMSGVTLDSLGTNDSLNATTMNCETTAAATTTSGGRKKRSKLRMLKKKKKDKNKGARVGVGGGDMTTPDTGYAGSATVEKKKKSRSSIKAIRKNVFGSSGGKKDKNKAPSASTSATTAETAVEPNENSSQSLSVQSGVLVPTAEQRPSSVGTATEDAVDVYNLQSAIGERLGKLRSDQEALHKHKGALCTVQGEVNAALDNVRGISSRVQQLLAEVSSLEKRLAASRQELERERDALGKVTGELGRLEEARERAEFDVRSTELSVSEQEGALSTLRTEVASAVMAGRAGPMLPEGGAGDGVVGNDVATARSNEIAPPQHQSERSEGADATTTVGLPMESDNASFDEPLPSSSLFPGVAAQTSETPTIPVAERPSLPEAAAASRGSGSVRVRPTTGTASTDKDSGSVDAADRENDSARLDQEKPAKGAWTPLMRHVSSFIRIHDLDLAEAQDAASNISTHSSSAESFFADGEVPRGPISGETGQLFPLHHDETPTVLFALARRGFEAATDESPRWTPNRDTAKLLAKRPHGNDGAAWSNAARGKDVLVWSGKFDQEGHGSEMPVAKARGLVNTTPRSLLDLLLDSKRTKEYNKMSIGREDEHFFQQGVETHCPVYGLKGEAKIIRSLSKPPLLKTMEFLNLIYARELDEEAGEGRGYITVTRSVWEDAEGKPKSVKSGVNRGEMLLGVNLIRSVQAGQRGDRCELTSITQVYSPAVPVSIGKKVGLSTAANFIRDIQSIYG